MTTNTTIKPTTRTTGSSANDKSKIKMLNNNNKKYKGEKKTNIISC